MCAPTARAITCAPSGETWWSATATWSSTSEGTEPGKGSAMKGV